VAIARALLGDPSVLLCDEPTGNLDSVNTESVLALFEELGDAGLTLVIVTHEEFVARRARRRVRMTDGRLTEEEQP
jgi:putative ABC transport system ATP-binding protein